ncbi:MAG: hypothetical protein GX593_01000 [Actinomycetales bacterium]|nr:hypothetical protein [Actinomycetales bacterium]
MRRASTLSRVFAGLVVPMRIVVGAAAAGLVTKVVGFDTEHAILLGLATLVIVLAVVVLRRGGASAAWLPDDRAETDGSRLEVAALSWSLLGRGGRVGEGALRRVRAVAAGRLARHGLSLERPQDHEQIRALLGPTAWTVLTANADMPSRREYEQCVAALERAAPDASEARP